MEELAFTLDNDGGPPLHGLITLPDATEARPAVVICHGFKGFMEWGFFPHLAHLLASRGLVAVRFNFTGTGMAPGDDLVTAPERFRANTFSREREELLRVLAATVGELAPGRIDPDRLGLLGHSRGGGAVVLAAAAEEWRDKLKVLVTWASVCRFDRFTEEQLAAWRRQGELPIVNGRTGQQLALGLELLEDLERHSECLDVRAAAARRQVPWRIVHGDQDETVPVAEARQLAEAGAGVTELQVIEGGGHTFGARHPFAGPTPALIEAMNLTQGWLLRYLR